MRNDKILAVSFSGGRTSAMMCHRLITEKPDLEKVFIFANTGKEKPETLDFVHECDQKFGLNLVWVEAKVNPTMGIGTSYREVDYFTASRDGQPFQDVIDKFGIPGPHAPFCTKELKIRPMKKWLNDHIGKKSWQFAVGLRIDEPARPRQDDIVYPFIDWWPTWEIQVRNFWAGMSFDLALKDYEGNCDLCYKKSLRKRLTIIKNDPAIADQWQQWENQSEYIFDRDGFTISDLVKMSNEQFQSAVDKYELHLKSPKLFDHDGEPVDLDRESSCFCKS